LARKILLADDSVTAQNMGRKILADAGYEVITVNNGSAALKKIAETKPDLIVLDVYMPGYSGLEVCQRVKETGETSRIPILLTVGKLEPFKPEEAKRVRADGYIVKPFEASELLSALTKLEDKIVPKAEGSKPGRFARTIAVVEEGRYDQTMVTKEDVGWKARIGFPSGKKKKEADADDVDDGAIYNQVNKDLRTVIERKSAQEERDTKVDLGALASAGLPKDVTPEEIAALAAAAAQIKGTTGIAGSETPAAQSEAKVEEKIEATASESKSDAPVETKAVEKVEPVAEKPQDTAAEISSSPSPADVTAVIAALEPATYSPSNASSGSAPESRVAADEPVTMAVAAGASAASLPRWTAVACALLPEEATLSLENEMQSAYAAFASAEPAAAAIAEPQAETVAAPVAETVASSSAGAEVTPSESAVPSEAAPTSSFAAKNFEVASAHRSEPSAPEPPAAETASLQTAGPVAEAVPEAAPAVEAKSYESAVAEVPVQTEPVQSEPVQAEQKHEDQTREDRQGQDRQPENLVHEDHQPAEAAAAPVSDAIAESNAELPAPASVSEVPAEQASASEPNQVSSEPAEVSAVSEPAVNAEEAVQESAHAESSETESAPAEPAHKEPDIAATTAAAWATWRRIRESGDSKSASSPGTSAKNTDEKHEDAPRDTAAMAVAAGAEKAPEEIQPPAESESSDIANIVDSVLADLRPQIVAEISKKMGKKK
jgi:CheY-like chemotaxis protein